MGLQEVGLQPQPHGPSWATACGFRKFVSSSNGDLRVDVALRRCGVAGGGLSSPLAGPAGGGSGDLSSALIGPEEEGALSVRVRLSDYCHHYGPVRANAGVPAIPPKAQRRSILGFSVSGSSLMSLMCVIPKGFILGKKKKKKKKEW